MASKRCGNGTWNYVIKCAGVLKRPIYLSFPSETDGDAYVAQLEALIDAGQVPREFTPAGKFKIIRDVAREYLRRSPVSNADKDVLPIVVRIVGRVELKHLDDNWADDWILNDLKRKRFLSTNTIRHYVGALARCLDWAFSKDLLYRPNPLRNLPHKYATYSSHDQPFLPPGKEIGSGERDRRLEPGEHERILSVFDHREFNLGRNEGNRDALRCIYLLAISTGMRLSEFFTLQRTQVVLEERTIFLDRTKNGKKRQVPLFPLARAALTDYLPKAGSEYLFPSFWRGGRLSERRNASRRLSQALIEIYRLAGCDGLRHHDLRHEATCWFYENTNLSDLEIAKSLGWSSFRVAMRYSNLRASNLAHPSRIRPRGKS